MGIDQKLVFTYVGFTVSFVQSHLNYCKYIREYTKFKKDVLQQCSPKSQAFLRPTNIRKTPPMSEATSNIPQYAIFTVRSCLHIHFPSYRNSPNSLCASAFRIYSALDYPG
jgi:hypothetical protein